MKIHTLVRSLITKMKKLSLIIFLLGSANLLADPPENTTITQDTIQQNDAINAPTSVMQNTQVNSGVTHESFGEGVSCARTTIQGGLIQSFNGVHDEPQVYIGFNMPIGTGDSCEVASRKQTSLVHQRTLGLKQRIKNENELHEKQMREKDLLYAELLANVCIKFHGKLFAEKDSYMAEQCETYSPINVKHGHKKADKKENKRYKRISDHTH